MLANANLSLAGIYRANFEVIFSTESLKIFAIDIKEIDRNSICQSALPETTEFQATNKLHVHYSGLVNSINTVLLKKGKKSILKSVYTSDMFVFNIQLFRTLPISFHFSKTLFD